MGDVDYVAAKKIQDNDTRLQHNPQFQQRVAMNVSSVHIPVEIYEGGTCTVCNGPLNGEWGLNNTRHLKEKSSEKQFHAVVKHEVILMKIFPKKMMKISRQP